MTPSPSAAESLPPGPRDPNGVPLAWWPDACQLLQTSDVQAMYPGEPFKQQPQIGKIAQTALPLPSGCQYQSASYKLGAEASLTLGAVSRSAAEARHRLQITKDVGCDTATPVPEIGDAAYACFGAQRAVRAVKGHVELEVMVLLAGTETHTLPDVHDRELAAAKAFAKLAADRVTT